MTDAMPRSRPTRALAALDSPATRRRLHAHDVGQRSKAAALALCRDADENRKHARALVTAAEDEAKKAAAVARDAGATWTQIGDAFGVKHSVALRMVQHHEAARNGGRR